jgi:2-hydroxychromene-2-carboxylate isomerase
MTIILQPMSDHRTITVYSDYKSPYAFLAERRIDHLARQTGAMPDRCHARPEP